MRTIVQLTLLKGSCLLLAVAGRAGAAELELVDKLKVTGEVRISTSSTASPLIFMPAPPSALTGNVGIGTTAPGAKLDVSGTLNATEITCPGCTSMQVRATGSCPIGQVIRTINQDGTVVCEIGTPASLIVLSTSTCPAGFQELTSFAGRFLKGVPVGGTVGDGSTVGTPLGELALLPAHDHGFTPAGSVSSSFAGSGGTTSSNDNAHSHVVDPPNTASNAPSAEICAKTTGSCPLSVGSTGHTHSADVGNVGSTSNSTTHSHGFTPSGTVSSSFAGSVLTTVATDHTPPYIQVRVCMRI